MIRRAEIFSLNRLSNPAHGKNKENWRTLTRSMKAADLQDKVRGTRMNFSQDNV